MAYAASVSTNRRFLGWNGPLLERAARAMVQGVDDPMGLAHVLVAVPGARAGRTLLSFLAAAARERGWKGFFPPRVLTQGRLVDELLRTTEPSADRSGECRRGVEGCGHGEQESHGERIDRG
ncbi:hypothetical protein Poly30_13370 [Planctomycetes bacterium Poly30]|uniref:Uncharacterized protein n=1 Tax=Saltatorellus ferox TaxID=2528018 RepID=A0A518EP19_9BACT|nr:hypothetical protein Poly30_13370 [Planctomycetes bacterium Poly30]